MAKAKKAKPEVVDNSDKLVQFETFRNLDSYESSRLKNKEPSCFNGWVRFKKYKITCELIEEPVEVYQQRLQELWDNNTNHHNNLPLINAAQQIGYEFKPKPNK